jgi:hypothetical protein
MKTLGAAAGQHDVEVPAAQFGSHELALIAARAIDDDSHISPLGTAAVANGAT